MNSLMLDAMRQLDEQRRDLPREPQAQEVEAETEQGNPPVVIKPAADLPAQAETGKGPKPESVMTLEAEAWAEMDTDTRVVA